MTRQLWRDLQCDGYGHGADGKGGGWPDLRQALLVRTTRELCEPAADAQPLVEDHHYLTSLRPDDPCYPPGALLALAREHWGIENQLHHVKDRTMHEDAQQHRQGAVAAARIRSLAVGLYRFVEGITVPAKQALIQARPRIAIKLLNRKRMPMHPIGL